MIQTANFLQFLRKAGTGSEGFGGGAAGPVFPGITAGTFIPHQQPDCLAVCAVVLFVDLNETLCLLLTGAVARV
jgi:hypothetical protein